MEIDFDGRFVIQFTADVMPDTRPNGHRITTKLEGALQDTYGRIIAVIDAGDGTIYNFDHIAYLRKIEE